jgi:hypothetical protein
MLGVVPGRKPGHDTVTGDSLPRHRHQAAPGSGYGFEANAARRADAAPLPGEQHAAEQIGPDRHPIEPPCVACEFDAEERRLVGDWTSLNLEGRKLAESLAGSGIIPNPMQLFCRFFKRILGWGGRPICVKLHGSVLYAV